jgi:thioredoxin 1
MENRKTLWFLFALFAVWLIVQVQREKADERIVELTDTTFQQAVSNHRAVLIEFGAPWCGPCRQVQPAINRLVGEYEPSVKFYHVNIDHAPKLKARHAANGIPLVALFVDGEEKQALLGARRYEEYKQLILDHVYKENAP